MSDDDHRDILVSDIPGYMEWSEKKIAEGGNDAFIANMDALTIRLTSEELGEIGESDFEEWLAEIRDACE